MEERTRPLARIVLAAVIVLALLATGFAPLPGVAAAPLPQAGGIAGCDDDPAALQAVQASVSSALTRMRSGDAWRVWRVHSICVRGSWAYAYVKSYSSSSLQPLPAPSDVALSWLAAGGWRSVLPEEGQAYNDTLAALPESLIPQAARATLVLPRPRGPTEMHYWNYALPYPAGETGYLLKHAYAAIDLDISMGAVIGTVRNAKGGVAVFVKGHSMVACGDPPPDWQCWQYANAVVIQSAPDEYAWYMHLAPNSIPAWIQEGVYVPAGADLGQEGVTGWASSTHLHFMVAATYACCTGSDDSRIPAWAQSTTHPVDFVEYAWDGLPSRAVSQNGTSAAPPAPPPPAPPSPPAAPPSTCSDPYTVLPGEWIKRIAGKCQVSDADLLAANPGINPDIIYPGQQLNMPGGSASVAAAPPTQPPALPPAGTCSGTRVVVPGDTLFRIAVNCGLSVAQMAAANDIYPPYIIYAGQSLRYP